MAIVPAGKSRKALAQPQPWRSMEEQVEKLMRMPFGSLALPGMELQMPRVDVSEDKKHVYVDADIPGMEQKDIHLSVEHGFLIMRGSREETREEKHKNYHRTERLQGSFLREVYLPSSVDAARITASYKQGVLKVVLPKKDEPRGREIKITAE